MANEAEERAVWMAEILDVLSNRNFALFTDNDPDAVPRIAQMLSQRNWDEILTENLMASPRFQAGVRRLQNLATREMLQDKTHRVHSRIGMIRGRLLAAETVKQRLLQRSPMLWVSKETSKVWQTPANGAVAGFLQSLLRTMRTSTGVQHPEVRRGFSLVSTLMRSEPLRHVDPDMNWKGFIFSSALTTKSEFYNTFAMWMKHYRSASKSRDSSSMREVLLGGWLASEKDERLLELFALSVTLKALMKLREWDELELKTGTKVDGSTQILARWKAVTVQVDFDKSPQVQGRYRWLLGRYSGIDGHGRRPDLQITSSEAGRSLTTLVEVKATPPNSPYGRDSIVKVMGYLHDFADLWSAEDHPSYCRAILLYRESVGALVGSDIRAQQDEILLTDPGEFDSDVSAVLELHLNILSRCGPSD